MRAEGGMTGRCLGRKRGARMADVIFLLLVEVLHTGSRSLALEHHPP